MKGMNVLLGVLAIAGLGTTLYSLSQQTKVQQQMNHTMVAIDQSIITSGQVTHQTNKVLAPLTATTTALADIEKQEQVTVGNLAAMNEHLSHINQSEAGIVQTLLALNQSTGGASTELSAIANVNRGLLSTSEQSSGQAATEASQVGQLNSMTTTSISEMTKLNNKLAALKALP
ncbi:hypothetical protein [Alicyclobacillus sp. ALC3]|uniref:hypothetical protein n=1 Tax=Alicyclobacillus sp. ALC3 TaxID=2796143 RepID=UPI0023788893|nr:hypothetical protein [Alicyclobacillus sp. ALC3]WDL98592.1 hypothetical protein JC200_07965 [Alicyclobacillus sp. ALC3]